MAFQYKLVFKLCIFSYKLRNNQQFPSQLKQVLIEKQNSLRSNASYSIKYFRTSYGQNTAEYFFPKFINFLLLKNDKLNTGLFILDLDFNHFISTILCNIDKLFFDFSTKFSKFDLKTYCRNYFK